MISDFHEELRAFAGRRLEKGLAPNAFLRMAEALWAMAAARSLKKKFKSLSNRPPAAREAHASPALLCIGGAVLGGAGKTPLCIELARGLAREHGKRTLLISHAYRAALGRAHIVGLNDNPFDIGDDALICARQLHGDGVPVIAARSHAEAFELARSLSPEVIVSDGLFIPPAGLHCESVLALDAGAPFGSGYCPPLGDLRAAPSILIECFTHCVILRDPCTPLDCAPSFPKGALVLENQIMGAINSEGMHFDLDDLKSCRIGIVLGIAHPDRIVRALRARGLNPGPILLFGDHARFSQSALEKQYHQHVKPFKKYQGSPELWLSSARCAPKLPARLWGAPVLALEHRIFVRPLLEKLGSSFVAPP